MFAHLKRKAFTMTELIIVIVAVAILAVNAIPRFDKSDTNLKLATNQVIDHILYTRSLAMQQDKFISHPVFYPEEKLKGITNKNQARLKGTRQWFKSRWQIQFETDGNKYYSNSYSIYSDKATGGTATSTQFKFERRVERDLLALDPATGKYMTARNQEEDKAQRGSSYSYEPEAKSQVMTALNLQEEYSVAILGLSTCYDISQRASIANRIFFDHLGRPYCNAPDNDADLNPYSRMATVGKAKSNGELDKNKRSLVLYLGLKEANCDTSADGTSDPENDSTKCQAICIEPMTGYAYECAWAL